MLSVPFVASTIDTAPAAACVTAMLLRDMMKKLSNSTQDSMDIVLFHFVLFFECVLVP
jgi:hypothetical protein